MKLGNGSLKVITGVLTGAVLLLGGALINSNTAASNHAATHISRQDAQAMVDRGDETVKELLTSKLETIEAKIDTLIATQGGE